MTREATAWVLGLPDVRSDLMLTKKIRSRVTEGAQRAGNKLADYLIVGAYGVEGAAPP